MIKRLALLALLGIRFVLLRASPPVAKPTISPTPIRAPALKPPATPPHTSTAAPRPTPPALPSLLTGYEQSYVFDPYTDCGTCPLDSTSRAVDECILTNWHKGLPFVGRFERRGIDSALIDSLVSPGQRTLISLTYDSNICGAGGWGPGCGERVFEYQCRGGNVVSRPKGERLTCQDPKRKR